MRLVLILLIVIISGSCKVNYSFTGASIPPDVKTVSVQYFDNRAPLANPTYSQQFTEALRNIFLTQTNLSLIPSAGDLEFEGYVAAYNVTPVAVQGNDFSTTSVNRLSITVNVRFTNKKDDKNDFESTFTRFSDFPATKTVAEVETELMRDINAQLVQDIFNRAVTNW